MSIFYICTLRMFDQRLAPHIKWYRNRYWWWDIYTGVVAWNHNTKSYILKLYVTSNWTHIQHQPYLLEQKRNYCVSDHGLWMDSLHILLVDLKSRQLHTRLPTGVLGVLYCDKSMTSWKSDCLGQVVLCEVLVSVSELVSCEVLTTSE